MGSRWRVEEEEGEGKEGGRLLHLTRFLLTLPGSCWIYYNMQPTLC